MKPFRVIQVATGAVGTHSLRTIIGRSDMELAGLFVFSSEKAGKDAGELIGATPIGVRATDDFDEILAIDADAVSFNPLGDTLDPAAALDQICRLLESGKNVCSTALSGLVYPSIMDRHGMKNRLNASCEKGGVSFYATGINPGFMMEVWPIVLGRIARQIDTIYMTEMVDMSRYTSEQVLLTLGYGKTPEEMSFELGFEHTREFAYFGSIMMIAEAMGLEIDDATAAWEGFAVDKPIVTPVTKVEPGRVGAVRVRVRAFSKGQLRIESQMLWMLGKDAAPADWPYGDGAWSIRIEGDPCMETRINTGTTYDAKQPDVLMTGAHGVNAIPAVVAARKGVLTHLDLPMFTGTFAR